MQYIPGSGDTTDIKGVFSNLEDKLLTYSFNLTDLGLSAEQGYDLGLRWTMTCANDVIEGGVTVASVPEPGTITLFGLGLLGFAGLVRKRNHG